MRQLNRLNQYQRLWQPSAVRRSRSPSASLPAAVFAASGMSDSAASGPGGGLAELAAQSGRGKRGELTFHVTPESLRNR
jgi:MarR-like DNA-binding transcriptional regulator SgrR of sgrS sRNA